MKIELAPSFEKSYQNSLIRYQPISSPEIVKIRSFLLAKDTFPKANILNPSIPEVCALARDVGFVLGDTIISLRRPF